MALRQGSVPKMGHTSVARPFIVQMEDLSAGQALEDFTIVDTPWARRQTAVYSVPCPSR